MNVIEIITVINWYLCIGVSFTALLSVIASVAYSMCTNESFFLGLVKSTNRAGLKHLLNLTFYWPYHVMHLVLSVFVRAKTASTADTIIALRNMMEEIQKDS